MSTISLPSYPARPPSFAIPSYSAEPQAYEQRLAFNRPTPRPSGSFVKQSKNLSLRLFAQEDNITLPMYGRAAAVEGAVTLAKPHGVTAVKVKIEGTLKLREVAEGGTTTYKLCLTKVTLWSKETSSEQCPTTLPFSLELPTTFSDGHDIYPLPPTHDVHLLGVPGFNATIEYSVGITVAKGKTSTLLRLGNGISISTPFIYHPRSRPALPLPPPMRQSFETFRYTMSPEWRCWQSKMNAKSAGGKDIECQGAPVAQLYLPTCRVFSIAQSIPFHVTFSSSAFSLAAFLPYGPTATILAPNKQYTRLRVLRQSTVDVRNTIVLGTKTDMWRVDTIGEAEFKHSGDGRDMLCFNGEICIDPQVKVGGFKAGGLTVKDFIEFTMMPPEPSKAPFGEMRLVVPIRLTTDAWSMGSVMQAVLDDLSVPPTPPAAN